MGDTVSTLLFQPPNPTKLKENKIIWLKTSRGKKIPGFYIHYSQEGGEESSRSLTVKELRAARTNEGITILYSHANAEDLGSIYPWCKFLSKMLRVNLFAYDYTGYGMAYDEGKEKSSKKRNDPRNFSLSHVTFNFQGAHQKKIAMPIFKLPTSS
jgi:hypothetical protein